MPDKQASDQLLELPGLEDVKDEFDALYARLAEKD